MLQQSDRKFLRLLSAFVIAAAITAGMLYGMNRVAVTLQMRDPTRYFRITDVIVPKPEGAAKRPQAAELPPPRAPVNYGDQGRQSERKKTGLSLPPPRVDTHTRAEQLRPQIAPVVPEQGEDPGAAGGN